MPILIKNVRQKHVVEFDQGAFDSWCVYLTKQGQPRYAPKDTEYFAFLHQQGLIFGSQRIYDDFVKFYQRTNRNIDAEVLNLITIISDGYDDVKEDIDIWFSVIYGGMVAEENKQNAILKKRIKRLGLHQVLIDGLEPSYAANFSRGKKWRELDVLMRERGF